jgi:hypothetical protein
MAGLGGLAKGGGTLVIMMGMSKPGAQHGKLIAGGVRWTPR